jgi:hypothetical protein
VLQQPGRCQAPPTSSAQISAVLPSMVMAAARVSGLSSSLPMVVMAPAGTQAAVGVPAHLTLSPVALAWIADRLHPRQQGPCDAHCSTGSEMYHFQLIAMTMPTGSLQRHQRCWDAWPSAASYSISTDAQPCRSMCRHPPSSDMSSMAAKNAKASAYTKKSLRSALGPRFLASWGTICRKGWWCWLGGGVEVWMREGADRRAGLAGLRHCWC